MHPNIYALLVGINNYPDPHHQLRGCVNDIRALEEYLNGRIDGSGFQFFPKVLLDKEATREALIDGFRTHLKKAGRGDTALFYFAGHGSQEIAAEEFWPI